MLYISRIKLIIRYIGALSLLLVLPCCSVHTTERRSANFDAMALYDNTIAIIPPKVKVVTVDVAYQTIRMYDYEDYMERILLQVIAERLQAMGLKASVLDRGQIIDLQLDSTAASIEQEIKKVISELYEPSLSQPKEEAFSISSHINTDSSPIFKVIGSRFIMLLFYKETIQTTGARVKNLIIDSLAGRQVTALPEISDITVLLIDTSTNAVVWSETCSKAADIFSSAWSSKDPNNPRGRKIANSLLSCTFKTLQATLDGK